jgi:histidinol phosphatase-like enzyme (inositol monophosphatase family)
MELSRDFFDLLAGAAREVVAKARHQRIGYDNKAEDIFDPVTSVDREVEQVLRKLISDAFPDDGICGEEFGGTADDADRIWSIDPIDGTRALICGLPSFATLIGVIEGGRHIAGMIDLPMLDERLIAIGPETRANGNPVAASGCTTLAKARMSTTDPFLFEGAEAVKFDAVRRATMVARYGLDAMAYARVATGDIDLVIESGLKRHDLDALIAVVRGAGGSIGDWDGGSDWESGRIIAAATQALYDEAVMLASA